jgi:hypothetical protein
MNSVTQCVHEGSNVRRRGRHAERKFRHNRDAKGTRRRGSVASVGNCTVLPWFACCLSTGPDDSGSIYSGIVKLAAKAGEGIEFGWEAAADGSSRGGYCTCRGRQTRYEKQGRMEWRCKMAYGCRRGEDMSSDEDDEKGENEAGRVMGS